MKPWEASRLDEILLVGGATRTPLIGRHLERELGLQPRCEVDPELCVAAGAAIQAAVIAGGPAASVLVDITPYTFGTSALSEVSGEMYPYKYVPLIRKNTVIPTAKSEVFCTYFDMQEAVEVMVYQGEDPDALNNTEIGRFMVEGLSKVPAGNTIVTTFSLDLDGILHVTAKEKATGLAKSISINNAITQFEEGEMEQARARIGELYEGETVDGGERHQSREHTRARALIEKAERLMETAGEEDREDLVDGIEAVSDAIAASDPEALRTAADELTDLVFYLEAWVERCPACRARLKGASICRRCGCDWTIALRIERQAKLLEHSAVAALSRNELATARSALHRARQLKTSRLQNVLFRFLEHGAAVPD